MTVRRLLTVLGGIALGVVSESSFAETPSVVVDAADRQLSGPLFGTGVNHPALAEAYALAGDVLTESLPKQLSAGGVNVPRANSSTAVHLYVVDVRELTARPDICGTGSTAPASLADICLRAAYISDNCAVVSATTIACDYQLFWRLARSASVLALASLKVPGEDRYWFPREETRLRFLSGEAGYPTRDARLKNLTDIEKLFAGKLDYLKEARTRVLRGFIAFILSHEVGHVRLGHGVGAALPPCAVSKPYASLCAPLDPREASADTAASEYLSRDLSPNAFTPARAAPELFVEEHERRVYRATVRLKKDPATWHYRSAPPEERAAFEPVWLSEIATGSHPKDLVRYVGLLSLLQSKGIVLTASLQAKKMAEDENALVQSICKKGALNGSAPLPSR